MVIGKVSPHVLHQVIKKLCWTSRGPQHCICTRYWHSQAISLCRLVFNGAMLTATSWNQGLVYPVSPPEDLLNTKCCMYIQESKTSLYIYLEPCLPSQIHIFYWVMNLLFLFNMKRMEKHFAFLLSLTRWKSESLMLLGCYILTITFHDHPLYTGNLSRK